MHNLATIGELTREFGVSARTLRFYEGEGLISPVRRGRQRLYPPRERTRLMLILRCKRLGLSLAEISEMLDICGRERGRAAELRHRISRIRRRRAEFDQKRCDIEAVLAELDQVEAACAARLAALGAGRERPGLGSV